MRHKRCVTLICFGLGLLYGVCGAQADNCPAVPRPAVDQPNIPGDVCIPADFSHNKNPIVFFDDYSWRAFIALVWPALNGQRGVPDPAKHVGETGSPLVFETYKADWEVFQPKGEAPSPWEAFGGVAVNPCASAVPAPGFDDLLLASLTKFGNLGEAGFGNLVGSLVAQNKTYVRYLAAFNRAEFDKIVKQKWFLRQNLRPGLTFDNGSVDIKTSWIDMTNVAHPERFYTRKAWLKDPKTETCALTTVGLVGMHIVQKTATRPQWIWSSFEHRDNVAQTDPDNIGPLTLNNGDPNQPMPASNPVPFPPPETPPAPFNVVRVKPINASTQTTNQNWRAALKGTVWENYELVMTQWPLAASQPQLPGSPANTFPGTIDQSTNFANTTMETFEQKSIGTGCMACHNLAKAKADFLWALQVNAFPPPTSTLTASSPASARTTLNAVPSSDALRQLKAMLESATGAPR